MANPVVKLWGKNSTRVEPSQPKTDEGWLAGEIPPAEFFNDLFYKYTDAILFMQANGAGEWVSNTTYKKGSIIERVGNIYKSKINSNIGNDPSIDNSNWEQLGGVASLLSQANDNRTAYNGTPTVSLDTYRKSGLFSIPSTALNKPDTDAGMMFVSIQDGAINGSQLFLSTSGKISLRYINSDVFTDWFTMVDTTRTINNKPLSSNIVLSSSDVGASASTHTHDKDSLGVVDFGSFGTTSTGNILFKTNSTAGIAPTSEQLEQGQLAINIADGILYTKDHNNTIISLGSLQPKAHTHSINDIISLQTALNEKADKLPSGVENNFMSLDASGNIKDSGRNDNSYLAKTANAVSATKLVTARTIALGGDVSGSASFDGTANVTITATVANDSHTHDTMYFTQSQTDAKFALKIDTNTQGVANGVATLDGGTKIPLSQIPDGTKLRTIAFATHQDMLNYNNSANEVIMAIVADDDGIGNGNTYVWDTASLDWVEMTTTAPVRSVNGKVGDITLTTSDIAEGTRLYYTNARVNAEVRATLIKDTTTTTDTLWSSSKINTLVATKEPVFSKNSAFNKSFAQTEGTGSGTTPAYANHTHPTSYYTKTEGDARYAKLAGLNTQIFKVKNAVANDDAVAYGQANARYAPISGANAGTALKWATARKITLAGDTTGNVTLDGSADVTLTVVVTNDSHTHDTRYYTKSALDTSIGAKLDKKTAQTDNQVMLVAGSGASFIQSGQTWASLKAEIAGKAQTSGVLTSGRFSQFDTNGNIIASAYSSASFEPLWTTTDLRNKSFGGTGTSTAVARSDHNHGVTYAKLAGDSAVIFSVKSSTSANSAINTTTGDGRYLAIGANAVSATKLNTARTIALGGDASGSVSFDGTANVTINVVVANDSHTHDTRYYTGAESNSLYVKKAGDAMSGYLQVEDILFVKASNENAHIWFKESSGINRNLIYSDATGSLHLRNENTQKSASFHADGHATISTQGTTADSLTRKDYVDSQVIGGVGYKWVNETSNRAKGITYTNTFGKPIMVSIYEVTGSNSHTHSLIVDGIKISTNSNGSTSNKSSTVTAIVPNNSTYAWDSNGTLDGWMELK